MSSSASSLNVLIAEDNPDIAKILSIFLARAGHNVTVEATAEDAFERLIRSQFDLLITDVDMGSGMDGIELTVDLRNQGSALPIIVMSDMDSRRAKQHLSGLSRVCFLPKPFTPVSALAKIEAVLALRTEGEAAAIPQL